MNDKNFIEELRQKREEYGVTQTRLAVACGISREYYNRIEKGKQPLNDELREVIEKQIERFNPQEPLFLLIDYFRVRFPTTDALAIIRDVLQLKSDYMVCRGKQRADTLNHKARALHFTKSVALATKTSCTNNKNGTGIRQRKSYNDTERYD